MSRVITKSCKDQTVDWMIERSATRCELIEFTLLGAIVFFIAYTITAGL